MKYKQQEIQSLLELKKDHCEACGTVQSQLDVHHWCHKGLANFSKSWNVVTLCRRCHSFFHNRGALEFIATYPHLESRYLEARITNRTLDPYQEARK